MSADRRDGAIEDSAVRTSHYPRRRSRRATFSRPRRGTHFPQFAGPWFLPTIRNRFQHGDSPPACNAAADPAVRRRQSLVQFRRADYCSYQSWCFKPIMRSFRANATLVAATTGSGAPPSAPLPTDTSLTKMQQPTTFGDSGRGRPKQTKRRNVPDIHRQTATTSDPIASRRPGRGKTVVAAMPTAIHGRPSFPGRE